MSHNPVVPGTPIAAVVSALPGGVAEQVLHLIANPPEGKNSMRYPRRFKQCGGNVWEGGVTVKGKEIPITVKLGVEEGLVLRDASGSTASLKSNGSLALSIGGNFPKKRLLGLAHSIVACYFVHGKNWTTRDGKMCPEPFGQTISPHRRRSKIPYVRRKREYSYFG